MSRSKPSLDHFSPSTRKHLESTFSSSYDSTYQKDTLKFLQDHPKEVEDAFSSKLEFGTGGLRALMGVGTNRLNEYTIEMTTQGLANYLKQKKSPKEKRVFISYDNRKNSFLYAKLTARVFAGNGIRVYIVKSLRPTPLCSFGCIHYHCDAAVMITASHNPPSYNGYKVYWKKGAQVLPPHDQNIMKQVALIDSPEQVFIAEEKNPLIHWVDHKLDERYFDSVRSLFQRYFGKAAKKLSLKIVYSNLHGTGITLVPRVLQNLGFSSIDLVKEQLPTDPNFPKAEKPNPEEKEALKLGASLLAKKNADLFLATDPDADRVGVVAMHQDVPRRFTGNQIACICLEFLLQHKENLPKNPAFVKTIVTSELFRAICQAHNFPCYDVLTGFKYIAKKIAEWEKSKEHTFVFGAEESLGYLLGSCVRDKDGAVASGLIALAAQQAKKQKMSLYALLKKIYASYGVYREHLFSISFPLEEKEKMNELMENLRKNPKKSLGPFQTKKVEDYQQSLAFDVETDLTTPLFLPKSNVIRYLFNEGSLILRPSGTEPKVKCYISSFSKEFESVDKGIDLCDQNLALLEKEVRKTLFWHFNADILRNF